MATRRTTAILHYSAVLFVLGGCGSSVDVSELTPECLARANFGNPNESPYVLPYPVGASYEVLQGYCGSGPWSSHNNRFAIDFDMRIGDQIIASRSGVVVAVVDRFDDSGNNEDSELNYLVIEHEDSTAAAYAHIQQNSAFVNVGDSVASGEPIANSGNSGYTDDNPHLHFEL